MIPKKIFHGKVLKKIFKLWKFNSFPKPKKDYQTLDGNIKKLVNKKIDN